MTLLSKATTPRVSTPNPAPNHRHSGWLAGETLAAGDACTVHSDGRVYRASGAAADAEARIYGWTAEAAPVGEAATLYDHVNLAYSSGLTPGTVYYLSADTPGGLDTAPSPGCSVPVAVAVDATRIHVHSNWGGAGGGAATVEAPLTLTGTNPIQAPLNVVQQDTGTATAPNVMALTHSLSSGTAAAGLGAGLAFRLQRDDDVVRTAAALVAQWLDAGGLGELHLTAYDNTTAYTARFSPTGLYLPNASGTPDLPINGVTLWADSGTLTVKGPDGVAHALPGAGGSLTPPVTLTGTDPNTTPLSIVAAPDQAIALLRISADAGEVFRVGVPDSAPTIQVWDSNTADAVVVLNAGHRITAGTPAAGVGAAFMLTLPISDDAVYGGGMTAVWADPSTQSSYLILNCYSADHSYVESLILRPEGLELPLQAAPSGSPPAGKIWLYADSADSHLKKKLSDGTVVDLG